MSIIQRLACCMSCKMSVLAAEGKQKALTKSLSTRLLLDGCTGLLEGKTYFRVEANGELPLHYKWQRDGLDLPAATGPVLALTNLTADAAGYYSVVVSNARGVGTIPAARLTVALDAVQQAMDQALDNSLPWRSGVSSAWFSQTSVSHDGTSAAQSGSITNSQESSLETSVAGPGILSFWWRVSSEPLYDRLELYVDKSSQLFQAMGMPPPYWESKAALSSPTPTGSFSGDRYKVKQLG